MAPEEVDRRVDQRVSLQLMPAQNEINRARAFAQSQFNEQRDKAQGWTTGVLRELTGGKALDEGGLQNAEDRFGSRHFLGMAMHQGAQLLSQVTADFRKQDWEYANQLAGLMDKLPGFRDEVRNDLLRAEAESERGYYDAADREFDRRIKLAGLIVDDLNKRYDQQLRGYDQQVKTWKHMSDQQMKAAAIELARKRLNVDTGLKRSSAARKAAEKRAELALKRLNVLIRRQQLELAKTREGRIAADTATDNARADRKLTLEIQKEKRLATQREASVSGASKAYASAASSIMSEGRRYLGKPVENPLLPGTYVGRDGKATTDPNKAKLSGRLPRQQAANAIYLTVAPSLQSYYSDGEIRQMIKVRLDALYGVPAKKKQQKKGTSRVTTDARR